MPPSSFTRQNASTLPASASVKAAMRLIVTNSGRNEAGRDDRKMNTSFERVLLVPGIFSEFMYPQVYRQFNVQASDTRHIVNLGMFSIF